MHAAYAAGREYTDAGHRRDNHRCGHRRCAVRATADHERKVAAAGLGHGLALLAEVADFGSGQARFQSTAENRDRRGNGAAFPDGAFGPKRSLDVLRLRHAMADDRRFERDDGFAVSQCVGDLFCDVEVATRRWRHAIPSAPARSPSAKERDCSVTGPRR